MGSDFRPHGCDPMGSAVGITPIEDYVLLGESCQG